MHPRFPLHDPGSAPEAATPMLAEVQKTFGMLPNLERTMASAPALLAAYSTLSDLFDTTSFSPTERQIVFQAINVEHGCTY